MTTDSDVSFGRNRVLVTGASGLVGSHLMHSLARAGYDTVALTRQRYAGAVQWDPDGRRIDVASLKGFAGVVHLAGENIAAGRWSRKRKQRILESRVAGTRFLTETLADLQSPPSVFVQASAIGYYGDRGEELLRETSAPGNGFLSEVCQQWERASQPMVERGARVARIRLGLVLSMRGGALPQMVRPMRFGLGGPLGTGEQITSWIEINDLLAAIKHVLETETLDGAVNCVAPQTVSNGELTKHLGRMMRRPTMLGVPRPLLRLLLGREMADELLLASTRVEPTRLLQSGFRFRFPTIEGALRHLLEAAGMLRDGSVESKTKVKRGTPS